MGTYIVRRILWLFVVLFVVSLITFVMEHSVPGGPFDREKKLSADIQANLNAKYHLDDPLYKQYLDYLNDVIVPRLSTGKAGPASVSEDYLIDFNVGDVRFQWMNFGPTYSSRGRSVSDIFRQQLPISGQLGVLALSIAIVIGIPLGIIAALKQNTLWDYL
ncbi:MAG TPA: ABC transporter permease [Anaerolineae bacterium]